MSDFQSADIDELLNEKPVEVPKEDINEAMRRFDRKLLSFETNIRVKPEWPSPIRKRLCTK